MTSKLRVHGLGLFVAFAALNLAGCPSTPPANHVSVEAMRELPTGDEASLSEDARAAELERLNNLAVESYTLKPGDSVEISVWGVSEMTRSVQVRPDGWITYLLVGDVQAEGRTPSDLGQEVGRRLATYVRDPRVTVIGTGFTGNTVSILGAVNSPGRLSFQGRIRLLDALAMAGGLENASLTNQTRQGVQAASSTGMADLRRAYMVRNGQMLPVDFYDLVINRDLRNNIPILANDFIFVPSSVENRVYVLGEVGNAGSIQFASEISVVAALAQASGADETNAWKKHVYLVRGSLREPKVAILDVQAMMIGQARDLPLQSGDILYVTATPLVTASRVAGQVLPLFNTIISGKSTKDAIQNF